MSAESSVITRQIPQLSFRAAFNPATIDVNKRTVDIVWSTGAKVLRGFFERFWEELSLDARHVRLDRLNNGAPLLDGHPLMLGDMRAVINRGVVVEGSAKVDGKRGIATVRFAKAEDDQEADVLFRKVQDGIVKNLSVGYRVYVYETIDDVNQEIPTRRATDWEPFEISTVSAGEDDGAGFRGADKSPFYTCEFKTRGVDAPRITDADRMRNLQFARARF